MPRIQYIGVATPNYFGKFMSEIAKNLKSRGKGRIVVKESELRQFSEPCFYMLDRVEPLLSDDTERRCRVWGRRIFRGHDLGMVLIQQTHHPDWRLIRSEEAEALLARQHLEQAPLQPVSCTAPIPPLLGIHLIRNGRLPRKTMSAIRPSSDSKTLSEAANRLLLLTKHSDDPTALLDPVEPTAEEQTRLHPPYTPTGDATSKDFFRHRKLSSEGYLIRRADTPGLFWRVVLGEDKTLDDDLGSEVTSGGDSQQRTCTGSAR